MNKRHILIPLILILVGIMAAGCASKSDFDDLAMRTRQDSDTKTQHIKELEAELLKARQALKDEIRKSDNTSKRTADIWVELKSLRREIAVLKGELEVLNIRLDRQVGATNATNTVPVLAQRLKNVEFVLTNQFNVDLPKVEPAPSILGNPAAANATAIDANGTAADNATNATNATAPTAKTPIVPTSTDPAKALYEKAYAEYKAKNYSDARRYWAEFVKTFKKHPFVPNALFWQAQSYYRMGELNRAALLADDVINKYKRSSKYRSALLLQGLIFHKLGQKKLARYRFEEIIDKYPKSPEAAQARKNLKLVSK